MTNLQDWKQVKSFLWVAVLVLMTAASCNQTKNEPEQKPQVPVLPQTQNTSSSQDAAATSVETPATAVQPAATAAPATSAQPAASQTGTQVVMNPPHGQPGHRCDIPVGAPLNSAPATTARQATVNSSAGGSAATQNSMAPTIENARRLNPSQSTASTSSSNSGKINPPHGQPGHRCDIAVGSPLP